jgi:exopolyphosphatase/pppGpp-phosphohydrolase
MRFLRHDPPRAREIQALRRETRKRLLGVLPRAHAGDTLIGLGGSLRALGRIFVRAIDKNGASLDWLELRRDDVAGVCARCWSRLPCASAGACAG